MDTIFLNGFAMSILSNKEHVKKIIDRRTNYYSLSNTSRFMIKLENNHPIRVDAHVWINNEKMGIWRINPYSNIIIIYFIK